MAALKNAFALLIGVGNDLPVTVRDANAIKNILADEKLAGYTPENIHLLCEEDATREGILQAFDKIIGKANQESSVLIFYSGHGGTYLDNDILPEGEKVPENQNRRHYYLLPNNFDPANFDETWVTADELKTKIRQIQSKRLVFFLDCCHAAGMTKSGGILASAPVAKNNLREPEALAQEIDSGQGISIISSCREDQQSYILDGDTNSLFTKCLVEVLKAKHKNEFSEPFIRITEVTQYLFRRVPELIENQKPYVNLQIYDDFVLSKVPASLIEAQENLESLEQPENAQEKREIKTVFRQTENAHNVVVFIHGFTGEAEETFGEIPELLINDNRFAGWDLYPLGLTQNVSPNLGKQVWASQTDVEMMADFLVTSIATKFQNYSRIALVSHGLGGIVTQLAILSLKEKDLRRVTHILLFSSPNSGLPEKSIEEIGQQAVAYLSEKGAFINELRVRWEQKFSSQYPFRFTVIAATEDEYIPAKTNLSPFEEQHHLVIRGNHFSVTKANTIDNDSYDVIAQNLLNNLFLNQLTTAEEVNLTLGKYKNVVDTLLPKKNELDIEGVKNLCFALEGLDRSQEAFKILDEHLAINENSEMISLLAGRFKRLYLTEFHNESALHSITLYQKALAISQEKNDARKIYYNAINLAFFAVVYEHDLNKMKEYNQLVKQALEADAFPSLWKLATEAESALYDANFERAKEYYQKTSALAGVRERLSIYTNAYTAYTHLMNTKNPNDPFISFLTQTFL